MPTRSLERLLDELEEAKTRRGKSPERTLAALPSARFSDAGRLIRFHEALLFLRAYPYSARVLSRVESLLKSIQDRVAGLASSGEDLSAFDEPEVSGIAGTTIVTDFSYDIVRFLKKRHGRREKADWEGYDVSDRLRGLWPRFLPLLEEEALEDANVPYLAYLLAARGKGSDEGLAWLLERIASLPLDPWEKAERFEALGISVSWDLGNTAATRTRMRRPVRNFFFHNAPLLPRREVSIEAELFGSPLPVRQLSRREGEALLDMARETSAVRYREYYGFTYGDPGSVRSVRPGRGVEIFLFGLDRERRLPLRAGFAGFIVKNGVPVGYVEALAFFDRIEIGFNIYYTFREGESAWIFAKVLNLLHQVLGVSSFSIDPYQIGHENKEAIESGAFWFYRKLGFRSANEKLRALTEREEKKIAAHPGYRSSRAVLRRLAGANLLYEIAPTKPGEWDNFHIRNLGLAVQRRMARDFGADAGRSRRASVSRVARILGARLEEWPTSARRAFGDLALVFDLIPELSTWTSLEKGALAAIARAKAGPDESRYLRLLQKHQRVREAILRMGSR